VPKHRYTPVMFSRKEIGQIRELIATPRARVACPVCGETLLLAGPIAGDSIGPTFEVMCRPCHRTAIITDVPGTPGSQTES
jgi:ribosomal protein S27E